MADGQVRSRTVSRRRVLTDASWATPVVMMAAAAPAHAASPTNSPGTMRFYLATIDQDQINADLSIRINIGWEPVSWNAVVYPQTMSVAITWTPALSIDSITPGNDGTWTVDSQMPGDVKMTRTGQFDNSGFQPEPEILLVKPSPASSVSVTFTATAPNTPTVIANASFHP